MLFCGVNWRRGYTVWSPFPRDTDYFGSSTRQVMVNYRVENLEEFLILL